MLREVALKDISNGRLYGINDMVKADSLGCQGCSYCCEAMVDTILLTPLDICRLEEATGKDFAGLLQREVEITREGGVILPRLKAITAANSGTRCGFLDENGRCSVHQKRPDLCRLFPLGRYYENGDFKYFLQEHECDHARVKIKVKKWIDIPMYEENKRYVLCWHDLVRELQESLAKAMQVNSEEVLEKQTSRITFFLELFYVRPYEGEALFYEAFEKRVTEWKQFSI